MTDNNYKDTLQVKIEYIKNKLDEIKLKNNDEDLKKPLDKHIKIMFLLIN